MDCKCCLLYTSYPDNTEDLIYLLLCMSGVLLVPANAASLHMSTAVSYTHLGTGTIVTLLLPFKKTEGR